MTLLARLRDLWRAMTETDAQAVVRRARAEARRRRRVRGWLRRHGYRT